MDIVVTGAEPRPRSHLVEALLDRGAPRCTGRPRHLEGPQRSAGRPVRLDLRDGDTIAAAARQAADATVVINNASTAAFATPLEADPATLHDEMLVNFDGTFDVIRAFVAVLERNGGGQIVNVLSLLASRARRR